VDTPEIGSDNERKPEKPEPEVVRFLEHLSLERRLSAHTLRNYKGALQKFAYWLGKDSNGNELNKVDMTNCPVLSY
jgi:site-specific recombinase XerD